MGVYIYGISLGIAEILLSNKGIWKMTEVKEPHGRLGDLDYVINLLQEDAEEYSDPDENGLHTDKWCGYMECIETLKKIQTVIEAENNTVTLDEKQRIDIGQYKQSRKLALEDGLVAEIKD